MKSVGLSIIIKQTIWALVMDLNLIFTTTSAALFPVSFNGLKSLFVPIRPAIILTPPTPCRAFVPRTITRSGLPYSTTSGRAKMMFFNVRGTTQNHLPANMTCNLDAAKLGMFNAARLILFPPLRTALDRAKMVLENSPAQSPYEHFATIRTCNGLFGSSCQISATHRTIFLSRMVSRQYKCFAAIRTNGFSSFSLGEATTLRGAKTDLPIIPLLNCDTTHFTCFHRNSVT